MEKIARGAYPTDACWKGTDATYVSRMGIGWVQAQSWTTFSTHTFNAYASEAQVCGLLLPSFYSSCCSL